jgi:hypothetical protein
MKILCISLLALTACSAFSQTNEVPRRGPPTGWSSFIRGGSVYNVETDLDSAGEFSVNRYYIEGGVAYLFRIDRMVSFSVGYGQDDYHFSGLPSEPWNNIDNYRASVFARWGLDNDWSCFAASSIRAYGESGVDLDDALTAAAFGGASYNFGDKLRLGPGLGVFGRIEDTPLVIPILIIDWKITEKLSLGNGGGLAATAGPGLTLGYTMSKHWNLSISGRYESKRFRLDGEGAAPNGIGEDKSIPILGSISYILYPGTQISGLLGTNLDGQLRIEDQNGAYISGDSYDNALFMGITVGIRL